MSSSPIAPTPPTLVRHEGMHLTDRTVHAAGHAYFNCVFERCTVVMTNTISHWDGCRFVACNFRLEYDVLAGDPSTRSDLRRVLDLIDASTGTPPAPAPQ